MCYGNILLHPSRRSVCLSARAHQDMVNLSITDEPSASSPQASHNASDTAQQSSTIPSSLYELLALAHEANTRYKNRKANSAAHMVLRASQQKPVCLKPVDPTKVSKSNNCQKSKVSAGPPISPQQKYATPPDEGS
ncbi:hypothetical protein VHEMI03698 [[Torrubiella] hemipterigena]|uniref:Uncharacterized protein n=1 Tax=[Torrubiella] hemipterigena TaxID=1531966 RepID=A0A0A1STC3_9HYPO|nr:hypothetical protein VHEMI03698 [[Torrubiella] hemipterigena]